MIRRKDGMWELNDKEMGDIQFWLSHAVSDLERVANNLEAEKCEKVSLEIFRTLIKMKAGKRK